MGNGYICYVEWKHVYVSWYFALNVRCSNINNLSQTREDLIPGLEQGAVSFLCVCPSYSYSLVVGVQVAWLPGVLLLIPLWFLQQHTWFSSAHQQNSINILGTVLYFLLPIVQAFMLFWQHRRMVLKYTNDLSLELKRCLPHFNAVFLCGLVAFQSHKVLFNQSCNVLFCVYIHFLFLTTHCCLLILLLRKTVIYYFK